MRSFVVIYGAGDYGKRLYHFLKSIGYTTDYFCQTVCNRKTVYDGIEMIDLWQLAEIKGKLHILISVGDKKASGLIRRQLLNQNLPDVHIYECGGFIGQNLTGEGNCQCNICGYSLKKFEKGVYPKSRIFDRYHIIGGGTRENAICPLCGCSDRIRWQYRVLGKHTGIFHEKCSVLHIAPEPEISVGIRTNKLCDYYTGDIEAGKAMHIMDVTKLQFADGLFDYIIMNHVLEHIEDEKGAVSELKRVLKPDGKLILSFPICMDMDTYEDPGIRIPEERLEQYGQEDHVRLYGKDYKTRLERYGLEISVFSPNRECTEKEIMRYGFIEDDVVMICRKVSREDLKC